MKSILNKAFRYTPSGSTNIELTFRRVRKQLKEQEQAQAAADAEAKAKVTLMKGKA